MQQKTLIKGALGVLALGAFVVLWPRLLPGNPNGAPAAQTAAAFAAAPVDPFVRRKQKHESALATMKKPQQRFYTLTETAVFAVDNKQWDKAEKYAHELLKLAPKFPKDWNYGNAIHKGHLVLGHVALHRNEMATAKAELLAAGKTPGSPQLDTFGPNMSLAKALTEKGETKIVIAYFDECSRFWAPRFSKLSEWRDDVMAGRTPDFGANLVY